MTVGTIVLQLGWFTMVYSRFFLGIHSLNQLIYGCLLGIWSLYMCYTWLNPLVVRTVYYVKENGWDDKTKKYFIVSAVYTAIVILAYIIAHVIIDGTGQYELKPEWRSSLEKCLLKKGVVGISKRKI